MFNEMKGHMSDPYSLLGTRVAEALYPTTPYGKNAGGEPSRARTQRSKRVTSSSWCAM